MVSFPISLFLAPYAIFLAVIAFFAFANLKNIVKYRTDDITAFFAVFIFLAGLAFVAYFSYQYLFPIDWKEPVSINFMSQEFNNF